MSFKVVIPARHGSTRLPGKALLDLGGQPMIRRVVEVALRSRAQEVWVATDDERIAAAARDSSNSSGPRAARAIITRADHVSGTDRIAEVAQGQGWGDDVIIVNLQGDEPQMPPELLNQVADLLVADTSADLATLCTPVASIQELLEPNVVKVVMSSAGAALYFSRAPIPWDRDAATQGEPARQNSHAGAARHLGIYAYRVGALLRLTRLPVSSLERIEKLEQLRALQAGMRIVVAAAIRPPGLGVDTAQELGRVRAQFARGSN